MVSSNAKESDVKGSSFASGVDPIVSVKNVIKKYTIGSRIITALDDVSLDIYDGEFLTIQGPSGCGKSTLLNLMSSMDNPTSGDVYIKGQLTSEMNDNQQSEFRANNVGFIFQFYNLVDHQTAIGNVELAINATGIKMKKKDRREKARKVLERLDLLSRMDNKPGELSGGEQQRVAIARAIVNNPAIIIADEPTGDLDTEIGGKIIDLFKELNEKEGRTIIIVTHNPEIGTLGKRRIMMRDYKIVSDN